MKKNEKYIIHPKRFVSVKYESINYCHTWKLRICTVRVVDTGASQFVLNLNKNIFGLKSVYRQKYHYLDKLYTNE